MEGDTLELNCTLIAYSKPEYNSSNMFFTVIFVNASERRVISRQYYSINGPRMLQLVYPNTSVTDTGTYECFMNETATSGTKLAGVLVAVGSK